MRVHHLDEFTSSAPAGTEIKLKDMANGDRVGVSIPELGLLACSPWSLVYSSVSPSSSLSSSSGIRLADLEESHKFLLDDLRSVSYCVNQQPADYSH